MNNEKLIELCHSMQLECIIEQDMVCIRPMLFDEEGRRVVRSYPDPSEFEKLTSLVEKIRKHSEKS